ncbi:hypothetical protein BZM26_28995 [Paraburkholderia strydomiana]|nr:hypothetical protein BZM26_28995 [Paraburkholderia strydomiana]
MGFDASENGRDARTYNPEMREMRFRKGLTGRKIRDARREAAFRIVAMTGMQFSDVGGLLGHLTSDVSSYWGITQDKTIAAASECGQSINDQAREGLLQAMFEDEPAADVRNPFLEPVASLQPAAPQPSPLTRVYDDMTRADALAVHLLALDAQLGADE